MKAKTEKVTVYLITNLPDGLTPRVIGVMEAAKRLHVTQSHVSRMVTGERKRTAAFERNVNIKELICHE